MDATFSAASQPPSGRDWTFGATTSGRAAFDDPSAGDASGRDIVRIAAAFSPDDCHKVLRLTVDRPSTWGYHSGIDIRRRRCRVCWLAPDESARWLYQTVESIFLQANARFGFDLTGFAGDLQFTEYETGMHFDWHVDSLAVGDSVRKLSLSIQLSDPADYDGGGLEFVRPGGELVLSRRLGTAIVFPSFTAHRVTEVTRGKRLALVAWAAGPPFR